MFSQHFPEPWDVSSGALLTLDVAGPRYEQWCIRWVCHIERRPRGVIDGRHGFPLDQIGFLNPFKSSASGDGNDAIALVTKLPQKEVSVAFK